MAKRKDGGHASRSTGRPTARSAYRAGAGERSRSWHKLNRFLELTLGSRPIPIIIGANQWYADFLIRMGRRVCKRQICDCAGGQYAFLPHFDAEITILLQCTGDDTGAAGTVPSSRFSCLRFYAFRKTCGPMPQAFAVVLFRRTSDILLIATRQDNHFRPRLSRRV